jgi:hypothetical protein
MKMRHSTLFLHVRMPRFTPSASVVAQHWKVARQRCHKEVISLRLDDRLTTSSTTRHRTGKRVPSSCWRQPPRPSTTPPSLLVFDVVVETRRLWPVLTDQQGRRPPPCTADPRAPSFLPPLSLLEQSNEEQIAQSWRLDDRGSLPKIFLAGRTNHDEQIGKSS